MSTSSQSRAESLLSAERRMLEAIANRASLLEVLDDLCRTIDAHAPGVISSVALMDPDGKRLWLGAGPRFPAELKPVAFPWPIGPGRGACGTAAFLKQRVIISDITIDPRWPDDCRDLPVSHGLRAAWSEPLISKDGAVLGTFAMYYGEPRIPDTGDLELIEAAGQIARIAIHLERSQVALRESEERFRLAAQAGKMFAYEWDVATDVIVRSGESAKILGIDEATPLTGHLAIGRVHPDDREGLQTAIAALSPENPFLQVTYRILRPDEGVIWVERHSLAYFDEHGKIKRIVGMVVDITERKRAEVALLRNAAIVESSDDAIVGTDVSGTVTNWNKGAERLFGYSASEAIGKNVYFLRPSDRSEEGQGNLMKVISGEAVRPYETVCQRKDGTGVDISLRISPIVDAEGRIVGTSGIARDITERKTTEHRMREYEKAVEGVEEMIVVVDREYRYLVANRKFLSMRHLTREQVVGRFAHEVLNKGVFEAVVKEKLDECFQGKVVRFEMKYTYPELGERDISVSYFPIEGTTGVDRVACILQDITERKRAEEALRESEERLRLAAQAGKMYAFEWDVTTDLLARSSEYVNVLDATEPRTLAQQQAMEKIHPDDRPKLLAAVARHSPENPTVDVTYRVLLPGKSPVWVKSSGRAFFDREGRILRVIGMVADVTDQKLAEEALRASEERLRLAQQAARIGTFERNIRTGVNTWTAEMESMYGLPPGGFGQTRTAFENLVHPDDRVEVIKLVDGALKTGQPTSGEWRVTWPDGSVHWIAGRWQALMDESGKPSRVVGVNIDVTERKQAEEALSGMTRKLVEAQEQERARIARELHDDINQRLALLAIELDQLGEKRTDVPSEVRDRMHELEQMTEDISSRVYDLSLELHSSIPDSLGLMKGMRSWCREFGKRQKLEIAFKSHDLPRLPQETSLCLFRVLQEALHNAAKHSGVKRIEVRLAKKSGEIHLIVSDSGQGFDIESAMQSPGLGLTSMQERVRLVGGTIVIDSKPLAGTTVHVRVPFRAARDYQHQVTPD